MLPWSPLAGGWLTGKYARDERPTGATRLGENPDLGMEAYGPRNAEQRTWRIIDAVHEVAEGRGASMSQVALAWVADRSAVTSVILGARTLAQLDDNLGAAELQLSDKETELLDDVSAPRSPTTHTASPASINAPASSRRRLARAVTSLASRLDAVA